MTNSPFLMQNYFRKRGIHDEKVLSNTGQTQKMMISFVTIPTAAHSPELSAAVGGEADDAPLVRPLVALALFVMLCRPVVYAADADILVSTFSDLEKAVVEADTAGTIEMEGSKIVSPYQLDVREDTTVSSIASTARKLLSSGNMTRLFFLRESSKLSLSGVSLVHGRAGRIGSRRSSRTVSFCSECGGGAIPSARVAS
jgi:hypothetical protein